MSAVDRLHERQRLLVEEAADLSIVLADLEHARPEPEPTQNAKEILERTFLELRDEFASRALGVARTLITDEVPTSVQIEAIAEAAYKIADAMLKARAA